MTLSQRLALIKRISNEQDALQHRWQRLLKVKVRLMSRAASAYKTGANTDSGQT